MKSIILSIIVCSTSFQVFAQDEATALWSVSPSLTYVRHFQGERLPRRTQEYPGTFYEGFEANGFSVRARIFNDSYKSVALTISGGVNWFTRPWFSYNSPSIRGVSEAVGNEFIVFPLGIGMQVVFPHKSRDGSCCLRGLKETYILFRERSGLTAKSNQATHSWVVSQ